MNYSCYISQTIELKKGLLDKVVDAVYVLTMNNSPRLKKVLQQIYEFNLHKLVYIIHNEGYKNCNKQVCDNNNNNKKCKKIDSSVDDLTNAVINVFKDSLKKNYNYILILEDDFILSPDLKNKNTIQHLYKIRNTILKSPDNIIVLGVIPHLSYPYYYNTRRSIASTGHHAAIYNTQIFNKIIKEEYRICDIDYYSNFKLNRYCYKSPLIVQLAEKTENFSTWGNTCVGNYLGYIFRFYMTFIISFFRLDDNKNVFSKYNQLYLIHSLICDIFIPLILLILLGNIIIGKYKK